MEENTAASIMLYGRCLRVDKVIVIVGPTAVGKTALSFALAEHFQTSLVSGDAYQIYRHMNIGTAKPAAEELQQYTHELIDIAEPDEPYSAAIFCRMAGDAIRRVNQSGRIPILVGGTGLYVQSLLEGYEFSAEPMKEALKKRAQMRMETLSQEALQQYIAAATDWEPSDWHELFANRHRLIRLLAAVENGEGKAFVRSGKAEGLVYDAYVVGLRLPRDVLYSRIETRVDMMVEQGWIEEVKGLLDAGVSVSCQAMKAIGYGELAQYIRGERTLADAVDEIKKRTRHFAKRQLTWYKRMAYIHWFDKDAYASEEALARDVIAHITWTGKDLDVEGYRSDQAGSHGCLPGSI